MADQSPSDSDHSGPESLGLEIELRRGLLAAIFQSQVQQPIAAHPFPRKRTIAPSPIEACDPPQLPIALDRFK